MGAFIDRLKREVPPKNRQDLFIENLELKQEELKGNKKVTDRYAKKPEDAEIPKAETAAPDNAVADYENSVDEGLVDFAERIINGKSKNTGAQNYSICGLLNDIC